MSHRIPQGIGVRDFHLIFGDSRGNFWISQGIEGITGFHRVSQGFERRVGLPPFVGGLRLRGFASLERRVCWLEHLLGISSRVDVPGTAYATVGIPRG